MNKDINQNIINNIRSLGIDMISNANSGHPGIVLGAAPIMYALFNDHLVLSKVDTNWINRDRFVLSAGHGSALLYATLHMAGYLSLDDLKKFRHLDGITPGHPEYGITPGVDASTGPLGQGIATAVGMAIASKYYENKYKVNNESVFNYRVYALCSDGDLMEGISYEAVSLAGSLKLNNLIVLYDSNHITLDGPTSISFTENIGKRFEALNWNYINVKDGNNYHDISLAIEKAKKANKPTLIEVNTIIGYGSINEGTNKVHGKVLDKFDIDNLKESYGFKKEAFYKIPNIDIYMQNNMSERNNKEYSRWSNLYRQYLSEHSANTFDFMYQKEDIFSLRGEDFVNTPEKVATRDLNEMVLNKISFNHPNLLGGSADLFSSVKNYIGDGNNFTFNNYLGKNIWFGIREHAMGSILNGMALCHLRPYGSTFLAFSDYLKPSIRMAALMELPVIYLFSHDSLLIGSDGPTHQPIEQLESLRMIPNMYVFRPSDLNEVIGTWNYILKVKNHPSAIILSKNNYPNNLKTSSELVSYGAYIIREASTLMGIIISSGDEVHLANLVANDLYKEYGLDLRVVSMVSKELFEKQTTEYQESILPKGNRVAVIEFSASGSWYKYVYSDRFLININNFGKSGTKDELEKHYKIDYDSIKEKIKAMFL